MAEIQVHILVRKRWFFWPAYGAIYALAWLGMVRDFTGAINWLVENGIVWRIR